MQYCLTVSSIYLRTHQWVRWILNAFGNLVHCTVLFIVQYKKFIFMTSVYKEESKKKGIQRQHSITQCYEAARIFNVSFRFIARYIKMWISYPFIASYLVELFSWYGVGTAARHLHVYPRRQHQGGNLLNSCIKTAHMSIHRTLSKSALCFPTGYLPPDGRKRYIELCCWLTGEETRS